MDSTKRPSSYLDKRFDRLRDQDFSSLNQQNKSSRALKKLQSNRLAVIGIIFSLTIILSSIFAPLITKYDPQKVDLRSMLKPPSSEHILGTDKIGRDVFARIIYGGRISIYGKEWKELYMYAQTNKLKFLSFGDAVLFKIQ